MHLIYERAIQTASCLRDVMHSISVTLSLTIEHGANYNNLGMSHTVEHSVPTFRENVFKGISFKISVVGRASDVPLTII